MALDAPPATVIVGCKAPNGLILNLDHYERINPDDKSNPNVRRVFGKATFKLLGWAHEFNQPDRTAEFGGYRLSAIPKDFWDQWYERNKESSLIADKIILPPHRDYAAQARDHAGVRRMFPGIDPENVVDPVTGNRVMGAGMEDSTKQTLRENGKAA